MKMTNGAMIGAGMGLGFAVVTCAALGGILRTWPSAAEAGPRDFDAFLDGAVFGLVTFGAVLAIPAAIVGALVGALDASLRQRRRDRKASVEPSHESQDALQAMDRCPACDRQRFVCECENLTCRICQVKMKYTGADDEKAYFECASCGSEQETTIGEVAR